MRRRTSVAWVITLALLMTWSGCDRSELTRGKAKGLIQKSEQFSPAGLPQNLSDEAVRSGIRSGLWSVTLASFGFVSNWSLTPKGSTYFSSVVVWGDRTSLGGSATLKMTRQVVDVTGIADASELGGPSSTIKGVQFTWKWNWDDVPSEVKALLQEPQTPVSKGEAELRLYDDGWRVEQVETAP